MADFSRRLWTYWRPYLTRLGLLIGGLLFLQQLVAAIASLWGRELPPLAPRFLIAALLYTGCAYFLQVWAWSTIMRSLGIPIRLREDLFHYFLAFIPRYIPGSVWGYISRGEWLQRRYGASQTASSVGSILEVCWLLLTAGFAVGLRHALASPNLWLGLTLAGVGLVVGSWWLTRGWRMIPGLKGRVFHLHASSIPGKQNDRRALDLWLLPFLYAGLWIAYGLSLDAVLRLLGADPTGVFGLGERIIEATAHMALAWSIGFLVFFIPAGLGVRELTLTTLLAATIVPSELAEVVAVSTRIAILLVELIWILAGVRRLRSL